VAGGACVAVMHGQLFPPRTRAFLAANFIRVGRLRVAGRRLTSSASGSAGPIAFDLAIPARYAIVAERGHPGGLLDGVPYEGPRDLKAGSHTYRHDGESQATALVWAQAVERGYLPRSFRGDSRVVRGGASWKGSGRPVGVTPE